MQKTQRGFTILELLVVVGIIAILSAVIIVSSTTIRQRNRDARRVADIRQIENALNLYFASSNQFPVSVEPTVLTGSDDVSNALTGGGHIPSVSTDPQSPTYDYTYSTNAGGTSYTISFCLETDSVQGFSIGCENSVTQ